MNVFVIPRLIQIKLQPVNGKRICSFYFCLKKQLPPSQHQLFLLCFIIVLHEISANCTAMPIYTAQF